MLVEYIAYTQYHRSAIILFKIVGYQDKLKALLQFTWAEPYVKPKMIGKNGILEIGDNWHLQLTHNKGDRKRPVSFDIAINADFWKDIVHQCFRLAPGKRGSIALFNGPAGTHRTFQRHITNEQFAIEMDPKRGDIGKYTRTGDQHYFDCMVYGLVALERDGFEPYSLEEFAEHDEAEDKPRGR